jgi:magnesium-transporting ATPase (P-type)|mmetsp:Transcript_41484/g.54591  ORF Transcript_41484/g.54591 Transcript_41484/m.54591 type:complete len:98 (+) Transcript_41484:695-988(+)
MSVDGPNNLIYKFEGCLEMLRESQLIGSGGPEKVQVPLNNDNIALRGMSLRNVEEVLGLIIYTGHETKIQMNTTKAAYKISKMMHATNLAIFWIFII